MCNISIAFHYIFFFLEKVRVSKENIGNEMDNTVTELQSMNYYIPGFGIAKYESYVQLSHLLRCLQLDIYFACEFYF